MKKKLLFFIFTMFLILPGLFILSACGRGNPPPPGDGGGDDVHIHFEDAGPKVMYTKADTHNFNDEYMPGDGLEIAVWLADYCDEATLVVKLDGELVTLVPQDLGDYDSRSISGLKHKVATFTLPEGLTGVHTVTYIVEEEVFSIKFVSDDQTLTEDERAILNDYRFSSKDESLLDMLDADITVQTTFTELVEDLGVSYTCSKAYGYYTDIGVFKSVDAENNWGHMIKDVKNSLYGLSPMMMGSGFSSKNIEVTFNKEFLKKSYVTLSGENALSKIFSYVDGTTEISKEQAGHYWSVDNSNDIKVYIEPYTGVDLTNVRVSIFDEEMTLYTDAQKNQKYFVIPAGALPVDYCNTSIQDLTYDSGKGFNVKVTGVVIGAGSDLYTQFLGTTNHSIVEPTWARFGYYTTEGTTYFKPGVTGVQFDFRLSSSTPALDTPVSLKINGATLSLAEYVAYNASLPDGSTTDDLDAWKNGNDDMKWNSYRVTIGGKSVLLIMGYNNSNRIYHIDVQFTATGDTVVELVF